MKKLLTLLLLTTLLISCSSDDDPEVNQGYTSFVVTIDASSDFPNCVAGYKLQNGNFKKIADLGTLTKGKYSSEIRVDDNTISNIYIFSDYNGTIRFDDTYKLAKNTKNTIVVKYGTKGILVDPKNPAQYPQ